jgi:hypothetical protein
MDGGVAKTCYRMVPLEDDPSKRDAVIDLGGYSGTLADILSGRHYDAQGLVVAHPYRRIPQLEQAPINVYMIVSTISCEHTHYKCSCHRIVSGGHCCHMDSCTTVGRDCHYCRCPHPALYSGRPLVEKCPGRRFRLAPASLSLSMLI